MILNSMQNTGNSNNSSSSFGLGVGKGNISGNVANSKGSGSYAQTEISSFIGTESVWIIVMYANCYSLGYVKMPQLNIGN